MMPAASAGEKPLACSAGDMSFVRAADHQAVNIGSVISRR